MFYYLLKLNPSRSDSDEEKNLTKTFNLTSLWCPKMFYEGLKGQLSKMREGKG